VQKLSRCFCAIRKGFDLVVSCKIVKENPENSHIHDVNVGYVTWTNVHVGCPSDVVINSAWWRKNRLETWRKHQGRPLIHTYISTARGSKYRWSWGQKGGSTTSFLTASAKARRNDAELSGSHSRPSSALTRRLSHARYSVTKKKPRDYDLDKFLWDA